MLYKKSGNPGVIFATTYASARIRYTKFCPECFPLNFTIVIFSAGANERNLHRLPDRPLLHVRQGVDFMNPFRPEFTDKYLWVLCSDF
jgi:hypothetical protein